MAKGLSSGTVTTSDLSRLAHEIYVPTFDSGALHYAIMEIVVGESAAGGWELKDKDKLVQPFPNLNCQLSAAEVAAVSDIPKLQQMQGTTGLTGTNAKRQ